ncbi:MAG: type II toxin-antitoxin system HipA family toxin [Verrucomicrobia bacterium]|nr:type II toxin-antitoxin system HipA family toxin [Verrucomicrobiota bacterium]
MKRLAVYLNEARVGVLTDGDEPVFAYDAGWLADGAAYPLSRRLPLQSEPFSGRVVQVFFAGLLPEAEPRDRIASILGISAGNDFALLERIGGECAGAVSLLPEETPPPSSGGGRLRWLDETELATILEALPRQPLMAGEDGVRLSLAGAQLKLPVVLATAHPAAEPRVALPLDGTPSTHIIKPEPTRFPGLVANEVWCLALARRLGLEAAEARSRTIGQTPCLIVKRYDRQSAAGEPVRRLHQEDFCQAMGFPPARKYQQEGGPSLRDCFALIRDWSSAPVLDIVRLLDAVIFAALTGNADAHAKNHSFLYAGGTRRMAPLYDQVCTLAWPELSTSLSMKIGSAGTLAEVSPEHFKQLSAEARLGWPMVRERLANLCAKMIESIRRDEIPTAPETAGSGPANLILPRAERMLRLMKE